MPKPTIVLVHGAWADGSSWNAVASALRMQEFSVLTPPNLLRRVTIDAPYIPDEGETVFQILGGSCSAFDIPDATTVFDLVGYPDSPDGDLEAFLKASTVHDAFAQDLPEDDRWLIAQSQRPITLSANTTPAGTPAWQSLPSWAVVGTEDRVIPAATQRQMAERAGATITEVAASHVSMVSNPRVTVDAILAAVTAVSDT